MNKLSWGTLARRMRAARIAWFQRSRHHLSYLDTNRVLVNPFPAEHQVACQ
jgi:hypothetical protein